MSAGPLVQTPSGALRGRLDDGVESFRGIRYAQPPVGSRRFRAPEPIGAWAGERDATAFSPIVPQPFDHLDEVLGASDQKQSEADSLTLSVWRPDGARDGDDLPVLVWIHGGALISGSSSWECYHGANFARDGLVFVGINYRVGAFGFVDFGLVTGEPGAVNLGLKDAVLALEWIRDHIGSFGGDRANVTIFGESAGGAMVSALVSLPVASGLFRRAALQSGSTAYLQEREAAAAIAASALEVLGVDADDRAALEAVPESALVALAHDPRLGEDVPGDSGFPWLMSREPGGLDLDVVAAVEAGRAQGVELVVGWTRDEYRLRWLVEEPVAWDVDRLDGDTHARAVALYAQDMPDASFDEVAEKVLNDQHFFAPAMRIAEAHAARGGTVRVYEFRWPSPVLGGRIGAAHALELPFVFDNLIAPGFHGDEPPAGLRDTMHGAWAALATDGDPGPWWPAYTIAQRAVALFDVKTVVAVDPYPARRDFWASLPTTLIGIA